MNNKEFKRLNNNEIFFNVKTEGMTDTVYVDDKGLVPVLKFKMFDDIDFLNHGFSTREGGVSQGFLSTMNLSFNLSDLKENVDENFRRIGKELDIRPDMMVYSKQTHTNNVLKVTKDMAGMGIVRDRSYDDIDALITDAPGICLVTSYADCIPIFIVDEKKRAIASIHAGWRGTQSNIVANTVISMEHEYGSRPCDLKAFVGPGICVNCYEVSLDVAEAFEKAYLEEQLNNILTKNKNGKYQLNLPMANYYNLINSGLIDEKINIADICTCCNSELLFSHRASHGKRGIMCGFMSIKEE